jgi:hypothetical protein
MSKISAGSVSETQESSAYQGPRFRESVSDSQPAADAPPKRIESISQNPPPKVAAAGQFASGGLGSASESLEERKAVLTEAMPAPNSADRDQMADLADTQSQMNVAAGSGSGARAAQAKMQTLEGAKAFAKKSAPPPTESEAANPAYSFQLYDLESSSSQAEVYLRISSPIFNCFSSSMSQYVKYDLSWNLFWTARLGSVTTYKAESLHSSLQDFSAELRCVEAAIRSAFKSELPPSQSEKKFQYRLIIKSN